MIQIIYYFVSYFIHAVQFSDRYVGVLPALMLRPITHVQYKLSSATATCILSCTAKATATTFCPCRMLVFRRTQITDDFSVLAATTGIYSNYSSFDFFNLKFNHSSYSKNLSFLTKLKYLPVTVSKPARDLSPVTCRYGH